VKIIEGSLESSFFGLPEIEFKNLARKIDFIIHAGCWVNGVLPYSSVRAANVLGTIECIKLAYQAGSNFKRFCYISSLSVSEFQQGKLRETDIPNVSKAQLIAKNGYATSKCVSEMLVRQAFSRGLPACIIRPGSISPSLISGRSNPNDFLPKYFLSITQMHKAPYLPEHKVSMVSVDFVSNLTLIVTTLFLPQTVIPVWHCMGSSEDNVYSVTTLTKLAQIEGHRIEEVEYDVWLRKLGEQQDPNTCALVPLKSYFSRGFPGSLDMESCSNEETMEFVKRYNSAEVGREGKLELYGLSPTRVSSFFSGNNLVALKSALQVNI